ncbi:MAG: methyl-accepting chemotaxis protein [Betaproteobacteria bacterium]|nr:methyl-accepting chemotaxis protein [Betaproteobacteria bacterium]
MFNNLKIGSRLYFLTAVTSVVTIVVAVFGILGMSKMDHEADVMYNEGAVVLAQLGKLEIAIVSLSAEFFRAFQHDPELAISKLHADHGLGDHLNKMESLLKQIDEAWNRFVSTRLTESEKKLVSNFSDNYERYVNDTVRPALAALRAEDFSPEVLSHYIQGYRARGAVLERSVDELINVNDALAKQNNEHSASAYSSSRLWMLSVLIGGLLLSMFISWRIIYSIVTPLSGLQKVIGEVERSGDLTRRMDVSSADEVGQTAASFNQLLSVLQTTLRDILDNVNRLDTAATELSTTAQQVAASSEMTSESSSAMAAAIEEMTVSVSHISQNAQETAEITQHTGELSQQGGDVIRQTVGEMHAMAEAVRESSKGIIELGKQSEQISSIVQVIKDVADQTNLLALNAAIEAARAGEQGRGFAVVADEVRKLAERTTSATGEIGAMISAIQSSSNSAVKTMGNATVRVESGVALADQAGSAITDIQEGAKQVRTHVGDITSVLAEQGVASQSIAQQVERVAQAAEENSAAARSSSEATKNIEQLTRSVRDAVLKFKVA